MDRLSGNESLLRELNFLRAAHSPKVDDAQVTFTRLFGDVTLPIDQSSPLRYEAPMFRAKSFSHPAIFLLFGSSALTPAMSLAVTPPCGNRSILDFSQMVQGAANLPSCLEQNRSNQLASVEFQPSLRETFFSPRLYRPEAAHAMPESIVTAGVAAAPSDALSAEERAAIGLKTTDNVLVHAESSFASIIHESQIKVSTETIEHTAGTFGDPSRYFQLLPGVVSANDQRNDLLVRGGNPAENLFVIDGIVIPSINHLALSDTTGGFVSMIDNDAIESLTLHSGVHDARFADRLSSVVEISTLPEGSHPLRRIVEVGLAGVGASSSLPWGNEGNLFFSGRQSILNLLTNDIGLNGVPKYTNSLMRFDRAFGEHDRIWGLSLTGIDSIAIRPDAKDPEETNTFNINYSGWRNTSGLNWQHVFSASTFGVLTVSNAEQAQNIQDNDQLLENATTYIERSHEGTSTATFNLTSVVTRWLLATGGVTHSTNRIDYNIEQPVPLPNPYSASITEPSNTSILQDFQTNLDSAFAQGTIALAHDGVLTLSGRAEHWGYGSHTSLTPRALFSIPILSHRVGLGYAEYTQMPSYLYLLAFPSNSALSPIRAEHTTFDLDLVRRSAATLTFSAYRKLYFNYPVPSAFPQLSMADVADTFGQSFLLFPLVSEGRGRSEGVELNLESHPLGRLHINASATYARTWYSGLDGVLRRGNFDIPLIANVSSYLTIGKGFALSTRYSGASGRPYTPDNITESYAQDRDVYDLSQVNLARSNPYGRLDIRIERKTKLGSGTLDWNVGLLNALNQKNFYDQVWASRADTVKNHVKYPLGDSEQDQTPRFPEGSLKYTF